MICSRNMFVFRIFYTFFPYFWTEIANVHVVFREAQSTFRLAKCLKGSIGKIQPIKLQSNLSIIMYIHRNYYTICVMSFCNHCKSQISSSALYLRFFGAIQIMHKLRKKNFQNNKISKNHVFSNFSCMFLNPNIFLRFEF